MGKLAGQKGVKFLMARSRATSDQGRARLRDRLQCQSSEGSRCRNPRSRAAAAHAVYKDDLVPLRGKQLVYDPTMKAF